MRPVAVSFFKNLPAFIRITSPPTSPAPSTLICTVQATNTWLWTAFLQRQLMTHGMYRLFKGLVITAPSWQKLCLTKRHDHHENPLFMGSHINSGEHTRGPPGSVLHKISPNKKSATRAPFSLNKKERILLIRAIFF